MKKRETELDILRLLATLGVIFTHASDIKPGSVTSNLIVTFFTATITWHVPVFVMISGRFFLDPERNVSFEKVIKAICRLAIAFLFWNAVYQSYYILTGNYNGLNWKGILSQSMIGPYHFWYLFMLICLYAITPFLRKIAESRNLMVYFAVLFFMFEFLTIYGPRLPFVGATIEQIISKAGFHFALGFSGYYILGYCLHRYQPTGKREIGIYVLGIAMLMFTGLATIWKVQQGAEGKEWFSKYLMPNVAIEAVALYTFFVNRIGKIHFSEKAEALISKLAEYSFGVYLVHALVLELFEGIRGICSAAENVGLRVISVFVVSAAATALIRKIPVIGKKIT
jgi:surface polysaccharide O-acyltransferase-like enzyme